MRQVTHCNEHWLIKFAGPKDILCGTQWLPMLTGQIKELNRCWVDRKDGEVE